jgi:hypothetical protein
MIAQATRAALLAIATVATRTGLWASHLARRGSTVSGLYFARLTKEVMPTISSLRDATSRVDTVNLKKVFGQIQADRCNLHGGWLPLLVGAFDSNHTLAL